MLGAGISVSWTVTNNGAATSASYWYDAVYLSDVPNFDPSTATLLQDFYEGSRSPLLSGGSYSESNVSISLPSYTVGDRYLLIVTDEYGDTSDGNRLDNVQAIPITLSAPTFAVSNAAVSPVTVDAGNNATVSVSWTVTNTSSVNAAVNWSDYVYLSASAAFDPAHATFLASSPSQTTLGAGADYTTNLTNVTIPNEPPGDYYIFVVADADKLQPQVGDATSVSAAAPVSLTSPGVDLQISNPVVATALVEGQNTPFSWTVNNNGSQQASGSWKDSVYLSLDDVFDASDRYLGTRYNSSSLAAGDSAVQSANFTIPQVNPGSYYVLFVANDGHLQGETNYDNNVTAAAVTVDAPDLVVTNVSATPSTTLLNSTVSVTWTVQNQGAVTAYASWYDGIYLSNKPTFDSSAQLLTTYYVGSPSTPLAAAGDYTQTTDVNIPKTAPGAKYLLVRADLYNYQGETDENNNVTAFPITLTAPDVDLEVTAVSADPTSVNSGGSVDVSWTVTNNGTDPAGGPWQDYVYLSTKSTFDASATVLSSFSAPSLPLAGGGHYDQTGTVYLDSVAPGDYYLFVSTNAYQSQSETNTANDVSAAAPITVLAPDLTVTAASASESSAILGSTISVSWTVQNDGGDVLSGFWTDAIYISSSTSLDGSATLVQYFDESGQAPLFNGDSYTETQDIVLPATATGDRYLLFVTDRYNDLSETNSANNVFAVPITLAAPDLTVTDASAPTTGVAGSTVAVSWTVENQGTVEAPHYWYDSIYISSSDVFDSTPASLTS